MAFREKSAWITLATTLIVYGGYFALAVPRLLAGRFGGFEFVAWLSTAILVIVVLQVGLTVIAAVSDPRGARQPRDEREQLIALRANRAGFYTLEVGGFFAIVTLFWWNDAAVIANGVFFAIVLAEVVRAGFQIVDYHRCVA
ncbi:MAG: hypothetical protein ABI454_10975 [Sphingomicrobium sp.]